MKAVLIKVFLILLALAAVVGISVYFGLTGGGAIDVNQQIRSTNQEDFTTPVNPDTRAVVPNGGLRPAGGEPTPQPPAPPAPEPVATSTEQGGATSTEAGDIPQDATPEGTDTGTQ